MTATYPYLEIEIGRYGELRANRKTLPIEVRASEDFLIYLKAVENGVDFDLTGYALRLTVTPVWGHSVIITQEVGTIITPAAGEFSIFVDRDMVDDWPTGLWQYILTGSNAVDGDIELIRGDFVVRGGAWTPIDMWMTDVVGVAGAIPRFADTSGRLAEVGAFSPLMDASGNLIFPANVVLNNNSSFGGADTSFVQWNYIFLSSDQSITFGPTGDGKAKNWMYLPLPILAYDRHLALRGAELTNDAGTGLLAADTLAAHGWVATQIGSSSPFPSITSSGSVDRVFISTGVVSGEGYRLEAPYFSVTASTLNIMAARLRIQTAFSLAFRIGLWDGTLDNAIYYERVDTDVGAGTMICKTAAAGVATSTDTGLGHDGNRNHYRICRNPDTGNIEFIISAASPPGGVGFQGENVSYAIHSTNIPAVALTPFFSIVNSDAVDRNVQISAIAISAEQAP